MPKHAITGAVALMLSTAPAAWADLDAQTIWSDWQSMYAGLGMEFTASSEEYSGGTLTLNDLSLTTEIAGAESLANYGTITLVEQGDGTVRVVVPAVVETTSTTEIEGFTQTQNLKLTNNGLSIVAREEGGERIYDISADSMTMDVETISELTPETPTVSMSLTGLVSEYRSGMGGDANAFAQTFSGDTLGISMVLDEGDSFDLAYLMSALEGDFSGRLPEVGADAVSSLALMNTNYDGTVTHTGSTMSLSVDNQDAPFDLQGTSESGSLGIGMDNGVISYDIGSVGTRMQMQLPMLPLPVSVSMAESKTAFDMPFGPVGEEQPFGLNLAYRDLAIDDTLWGLFDPTGQLPRDPATLLIEMDGTAVVNVDLFNDPEAMIALQGPPADIKGLAIKQILLSLAGAELRGSGDLDFPVSGPIPLPVGTIELALDGGFGLIDKIVALGFIPAEQAAFVKGMAGAVAKPVGDDQLESTIEFTPGGGITANGLPLR